MFTLDRVKGPAYVAVVPSPATCWGTIGFETLAVDLRWTPDGSYSSTAHTNAFASYGDNAPSMSQGRMSYWNATVEGTVRVNDEAVVDVQPEWGSTYWYRALSNSKW